MNILITRTKRKKTISIQVKNGNIEVKAPFILNQSSIVSFIQKKEKWIKNKIELQKSIEGEIFKFIGEDLILKINIGNKKEAYIKNGFLYLTINNKDNNKEKIKKKMELFYRGLSKKILEEKTFSHSKKMNLYPKKVKVRSYKNRWGSCAYNGDISYNWKLIMLPEKIIDYVIVHELCHLIHFNHSKDFWREVIKILPNYKDSREWLRSNQYLYNW